MKLEDFSIILLVGILVAIMIWVIFSQVVTELYEHNRINKNFPFYKLLYTIATTPTEDNDHKFVQRYLSMGVRVKRDSQALDRYLIRGGLEREKKYPKDYQIPTFKKIESGAMYQFMDKLDLWWEAHSLLIDIPVLSICFLCFIWGWLNRK